MEKLEVNEYWNPVDTAYIQLLWDVYHNGFEVPTDRTGVGTRCRIGKEFRVDTENLTIYPILSLRKIYFRSVVAETLWFLSGRCRNIKALNDVGVHLWDKWAEPGGWVGPIYGKQWRKWRTGDFSSWDTEELLIDQIQPLKNDLVSNPYSRRHIVSAWNVADLANMALPPCHVMWQCNIEPVKGGKDKLHLQVYMRSCDLYIGLPYNIASYALIMELLCKELGFCGGELIFSISNAHLYNNHMEQTELLFSRYRNYNELASGKMLAPCLFVAEDFDFNTYALSKEQMAKIRLVDYTPAPELPAPVAV